jgi:DHA1 family tetracycline resistance protein-like MFS transporter
LLALSFGLFAVADSISAALVASAVIGCASSLTNTTGMYVFATAGDTSRRGASMALYVTALMSGQMLGPTIGGAIGSLAGWRAALAVSAVIGVGVAVVCVGGLRRRGVRSPPVVPRRAAGSADEADPAQAPARRELFALALTPFSAFFAIAGLTQTLIPLVGDAELGFSASAIGLAIGGGAAIRFGSAWFAGVASDRISRKAVLVPGLAAMALGAAILAASQSVAAWSMAIALVALGSSGISVAAAAVADVVPVRALGHELGLFRLVGDLGLVIGPIVTGFVYQASGPGAASMIAAGVVAVAALATAAWVRNHRAGDSGAGDTGEILLSR